MVVGLDSWTLDPACLTLTIHLSKKYNNLNLIVKIILVLYLGGGPAYFLTFGESSIGFGYIRAYDFKKLSEEIWRVSSLTSRGQQRSNSLIRKTVHCISAT